MGAPLGLGRRPSGESGTVAAVPTIVNAVVDARAEPGVTDVDIPVTPEKVWRILKEKGCSRIGLSLRYALRLTAMRLRFFATLRMTV